MREGSYVGQARTRTGIERVRLVVEVESVGHFIVKAPNDNRKHLQLTPGSICRIGWQSDDCHALDGTQTQSSEVAA